MNAEELREGRKALEAVSNSDRKPPLFVLDTGFVEIDSALGWLWNHAESLIALAEENARLKAEVERLRGEVKKLRDIVGDAELL